MQCVHALNMCFSNPYENLIQSICNTLNLHMGNIYDMVLNSKGIKGCETLNFELELSLFPLKA